MSAARTARRRRRQAKLGHKGLKQIYGMRAAPKYPGAVSAEKSADQLLRARENARRGIAH